MIASWPLNYFLFCLFSLSLLCPELAQSQDSDSSLVAQKTKNLLKQYYSQLGQNNQLFSGTDYIPNGQRAEGTPFFEVDPVSKGTICYNNSLFPGVSIRYDLVADQLILEDSLYMGNIQLVREHINYFSFPGHYFVYLTPEKSALAFMPVGFFEQLSFGEIPVYARHEKKLIFPQRAEDPPKYQQSNGYFLQLKGRYFKVDSKNDLLRVLKDKKDQVKKFIRDNGLNFNKKIEESLVKSAQFYSSLIP